jgi:adenylate cyclase class 2
MYEVEVKVRADHAAVREALREAGATRRAAVTQRDTYYDHPGRDFAATDEALRVRRETGEDPGQRAGEADVDADGNETAAITYKGPRVDAESKTRTEIETEVADGDDAARVLRAVDFESVATVEKEREYWALSGYTVTLDSVTGLGEFVEVETETETADVDPAREGAFAVLERLGLDPGTQIRTSYLGLLLDGGNEGTDGRENNQQE